MSNSETLPQATETAATPAVEQEFHWLSEMHFREVIRTEGETRQEAEQLKRAKHDAPSVAAFLWHAKEDFVPLADVLLLTQASRMDHQLHRQVITMTLTRAAIDPADWSVSFSEVITSHDFGKNPRIGATGDRLDPRDARQVQRRKGQKPNQQLVLLGLFCFRERLRVKRFNYKLPAAPKNMPVFLAGFDSPGDVDIVVTRAALERLATVTGEGPGKLRRKYDDAELISKISEHWMDWWVAPNTPTNPSSHWVIPMDLLADASTACEFYADLRNLPRLQCQNPAKAVMAAGLEVENLTSAICDELGVDLAALFEGGITDAEDEAAVEAMEQANIAFGQIREKFREYLGEMASLISDDDIDYAITKPDSPIRLEIQDLQQLPSDIATELLRQQLAASDPAMAAVVTDAELLQAAATPDLAITAGVFAPEVIWINPGQPLQDVLNFSPPAVSGRVHLQPMRPMVHKKPRQAKRG